MTSKPKKIIIGRGGFGTVYYYSDRPGIAYKESHTKCDDIRKEYEIWKKAYNAYIKYGKSIRKKACILHPSNWKEFDSTCMFQMARVVPLEGNYTWQAYIGDDENPERDLVFIKEGKIRGRYMGPQTLSKYFNVEELAYDAGILIGIVHFCAKLDGKDTELIVGKLHKEEDSKCRLFLIDFDQTGSWEGLEEKEAIDTLTWSLDAEPYYPNEDSPYYDSFKEGYLKVAQKCNLEGFAEKILDRRF